VKRVGQVLTVLLGLVMIVAAGAAAVLLFVLAIRQGSTFWAAVVASAATVGGAWIVRGYERRKVADSVRREKLDDLYTEMAQVLHGREFGDEERDALIQSFMRGTLVYASAKTLKTFQEWRLGLPGNEEGWSDSVIVGNSLRYEAFVKAMRDDLGITNRGLKDGDLARMGINDYDEIAARVKRV
jgi:hypothetical protein